MQLAFLEKMTKEGFISAKQRAEIYRDCSAILTKAATVAPTNAEMKKRWGDALTAVGSGLLQYVVAPAALGIAIGSTGRKIDQLLFAPRRERKDVQEIISLRHNIGISPEFLANKDKALARFDEIVSIAPRIGVMPTLMKKLITEHLHSGFTREDIQRLAQLQASYSPDMRESEKVQGKLQRFSKTSSALPMKVQGVICADVVRIMDESGLFKEAARFIGYPRKQRVVSRAAAQLSKPSQYVAKDLRKNTASDRAWEVAKHVLQTGAIVSGIGAITGIGTGAINVLMKALDKRKLEKQLQNSFDEAMNRSDPNREPLHANKDKARIAFQTLTHFAPHVAAEPEAARAFMLNIVSMDQGAQPGIIKDISDIESKLRGSKGSNPFFEGLAAGSSAMGLQSSLSKATSTMLDPFVQQSQAEIRHQADY